MTVHYKNKRISRAVLAGIFLAAAGLLWGIRDVSAGTEVEVEGQAAGGVFFYDTETELNIYLTRNLYFKYGYTSNSITQGHVTAVFDGATYNPADGSYEIGHVIAPGVYNFHLAYSVSGSEKSDPICWSAWIGYTNYQHTVYIYDCRLPYVKISYGQTINGTITVSDVGQTIKLEAVSGDNQTSYSGIQFPQKLVARAIKSDGQLVSGKQVVFSLKSGPQPDPQAAFTNPSATTASDGTVETFFTLSGPTYYPYTIKAYCADCVFQQEALFTETLVEKTNVLQKLPDGDNQTWLVGETLPKQLSVKVVDSHNNPVDGVDIRFSVSSPQQGDWSFPGNVKEITIKTDKGVAKTDFKLGTAAGDYTIDAACAICAAGNNSVSFTATALTNTQATELQEYDCGGSDFITSKLNDGVRVWAINKLTSKPVAGRAVTFTLVSHPGGTGMSLTPVPPDAVLTKNNGVAKADLTLGNLPGNYRVSAVCQGCEGNQQVVCNIAALPKPDLYNVLPKVAPIALKTSPITVTLNPYIVPPGGTAAVSVKGPANIGLVPSVEPVPNTGGHQHDVEGRPYGTVSPVMGILDGNGDATFTYTAGEVGGQERIIINAPELPDYGDAVVLVSVAGMSRLGPSPDYFLSGETPTHPSNHYGSELLRQEILNIAKAYTDEYGAFMRVNDMSLINGGLFDVCGNWNTAGCTRIPNGGHETHRDGKNADFGYYHITTQGQRRRIPDMYNRLNNLLLTHTTINCQTTYAGSHIECPKRN